MTASSNDESFRRLFEPYRRAITLHCYRMLGSLQDAEEVVQEALLRAWQRHDEVTEASATRAWLYRIATNACLDHLRKTNRRRALPHLGGAPASTAMRIGPPAEEWLWVEPVPDALFDVPDELHVQPDERVSLRESVGLAFIVALQALSPKQRAALLLVDVVGWKPEEAASLLETSVASVNSLLQRARAGVESRSKDPAHPGVTSSDADLLRRFITAWETSDLDAFTSLLAEDALFSMPPQPEWFAGRDAIGRFFAAMWTAVPGQRRLVPLAANGGPAVAVYNKPPAPNAAYLGVAIMNLVIRDGRVSEMTRFAFPRLFSLFGLPEALPGD